MIKQIIYIGPLKININAEDSMQELLCNKIFEHNICTIKENYYVNALIIDNIIPSGKLLYEGNGIEVRRQDLDTEERYSYQVIDGIKHYFAHYSLKGNQIYIELLQNLPLSSDEPYELWRFMFLEELLLKHDAFILHSASVIYNDNAILFSAPSGTGKSTQADLWKDTISNCIGLNGDRNLIYKNNGKWFVLGLPWHGSSNDCLNVQCQLKVIAYVNRNERDFIKSLSSFEQQTLLYGEVTVNRWEIEQVNHVFNLLDILTKEIPIVTLNCTPTKKAVLTLKSFIDGGNDGNI